MCPLPALGAPAPSLFMTPTATQHCSLSTPVPSSYCVQAQGGGSVGASWSYGAGMQWEHQPSAQPMRAADGFSQAGCIRPLGVGAVGASPEGHLRGLVVYEHCVQTYMLHSTRVCVCGQRVPASVWLWEAGGQLCVLPCVVPAHNIVLLGDEWVENRGEKE